MLNIPFYKNTGSTSLFLPVFRTGVVEVKPNKWVGGNFYTPIAAKFTALQSNTELGVEPDYLDIVYIYETEKPAISVEKDTILEAAPAVVIPEGDRAVLFNNAGALGSSSSVLIDATECLVVDTKVKASTINSSALGDSLTVQLYPTNYGDNTGALPVTNGPDILFYAGSAEASYLVMEGHGRGGDIWFTAGNAARGQFDATGGRGGDIHLVPGNKAGFVPESRPGTVIVHNQLRLSNDWGGVAFLEEVTHGGGRLYLSRGTGSSQDITLDVGTDNQYPFLELTGWMNSSSPYTDYSKLKLYAGAYGEYGLEVTTGGSGTDNIDFNIKTAGTGKIKCNNTLNITNVPTYVDNAAAVAGGLSVGDVYKTAAGDLKIRV